MRPAIIDELDYKKADALIGTLPATAHRNKKFFEGDHFQDGAGWIGPRPSPLDENSEEIWSRIVNGFVSKNIVKEITERVVLALLGQDPDWSFTYRSPRRLVKKQVPDPADPNDQIDDPSGQLIKEPLSESERKQLNEAHDLMMEWWTHTQPLKRLKEALRERLYAGKGCTMLFVPRAFQLADGRAITMSANQWARYGIFPDTPGADNATVVTDPSTMMPVGLVRKTRDGQNVIELSYVDTDNGKTVVIVLAKNEQSDSSADDQLADALEDELERSDPLNLGGHITVFEIKGEPLISDQIVQNNQLCNMALTMMGHNVVETGFSELALTNVELDTKDVTGPDGVTRKVAQSIRRGAGAVQNFVGVQTEDPATGKVTVATPGVHYHEPGSVETFVKTKEIAYVNCLEEARQLHALLSKDASPSGESRIQALSDFIITVMEYKDDLDMMGRAMLEAAFAIITDLTGQSEKYKDLRAVFTSRIYVGKVTAAERSEIIQEVKEGLRSKASAMVLLGIDDPDAMQEEIDQEKGPSQPTQPPPPTPQP